MLTGRLTGGTRELDLTMCGPAIGTRRARAIAMHPVKDVIQTIGSVGDLAKRVGSNSAALAKRVGTRTSHIAREVGPKRTLIGLAIAGVAIGGTIFLVRYLRARKAERSVESEPNEAGSSSGRSKRNAHAHAAP